MCIQTDRLDSQCGRACSVQCGTGRPLAQRYTSLPARGSKCRPGSGRRTGRWTEALTSDCLPHCRYMSGCDRQTCRSCASPSPCTSTGRTGSRWQRGQETEDTGVVRVKKEGAAGWLSYFHYSCILQFLVSDFIDLIHECWCPFYKRFWAKKKDSYKSLLTDTAQNLQLQP